MATARPLAALSAFALLALVPVAAALLPPVDLHVELPPPGTCVAGMCAGPGAESVTVQAATLPRPAIGPVAVWDGSQVHLLFGSCYDYDVGGTDCLESPYIYHYDPATDTVTESPVTLGTGLYYSTGVWTGSAAYLFGGCNSGDAGPFWGCPNGKVVRYEPGSGTLTVLDGVLPYGVSAAASFWDGTHAYILGGCTTGAGCPSQNVLRFDPSTETAEDLGPLLARPEEFLMAAWTGEVAYVFGGSSGATAVDAFDPAAGIVSPTAMALPHALEAAGAVWDGSRVLAFGGWDSAPGAGLTDGILALTPSTGEVATLGATLPGARAYAPAVWVPGHGGDGCPAGCAFVFGGYGHTATGSWSEAGRQVLRFAGDATPWPFEAVVDVEATLP